MTTFTCPSCGKTIGAEVPAGSQVTCPLCNQVVTVPGGVPATGPQAVPPTQAPWSPRPGIPMSRGLAITSMVLGILGIFTSCLPVLGIVALILGIVSLVKASRRPMEYGGKGFAIAGICLGGISLLLMPFFLMMVAIMLPSLSKARDLAKRSVCAANLGGTAKAFAIYANQYRGEYPPNVDALVASGLAQPRQFVCPSSLGENQWANTTITYNAGQPISPQLHDMLHSCYVYIPGQNEGSNPNNVLMYEKKDDHRGEGSNVLFNDCHVEWVQPYSKVEELVAKTKARLGASEEAPAESQPEF